METQIYLHVRHAVDSVAGDGYDSRMDSAEMMPAGGGAGGIATIALPTAVPPGGICLRDPGRMHRRLLGAAAAGGASQFHVMSRTTGGQLLFGAEEKEAFRLLMWRLARFCGVEVLTYCVMGNHFHLLVRVPRRESFLHRFVSEEAGDAGERHLLSHLELLYSEAYLSRLGREIAELRRAGREAEVQRVLDGYRARLCDLSLFVKELKERFSRWFNKRHGRRGTLWMGRFRSVLVEGGACLRTVAAYIDLNPVRAGLVARPEDYRWCGYSEALGGGGRIRRGLCRAIGWPAGSWGKRGGRKHSGSEAYRCLLYGDGIGRAAEAPGGPGVGRRGIAVEEAREVIGRGGRLSHYDLIRCRVRWFTEGVAIGSRGFLRRALESDTAPNVDVEALRPVPAEGGGSGVWFSLSRLRRMGVG
jgi:putative transposase